ncbi:hypothetical protein KQX54_001398 [Cotesia glomerata]|uniref:Uncharacterized protein n=1 Tax=Cotesia glomerata TaxID=32391 RepID=A0AAV7IH46_COTGL|nr:hypothetical protein KQX54_001398 [Cotesia glomerata]
MRSRENREHGCGEIGATGEPFRRVYPVLLFTRVPRGKRRNFCRACLCHCTEWSKIDESVEREDEDSASDDERVSLPREKETEDEDEDGEYMQQQQ